LRSRQQRCIHNERVFGTYIDMRRRQKTITKKDNDKKEQRHKRKDPLSKEEGNISEYLLSTTAA